jgi:hypothetical protein
MLEVTGKSDSQFLVKGPLALLFTPPKFSLDSGINID